MNTNPLLLILFKQKTILRNHVFSSRTVIRCIEKDEGFSNEAGLAMSHVGQAARCRPECLPDTGVLHVQNTPDRRNAGWGQVLCNSNAGIELQLLNVCINKPFKDFVSGEYEDRHSENSQVVPAGYKKGVSLHGHEGDRESM